MDWPKIKTILIFVLLVTNIVLGATYISDQQRYETEIRDNLQDVIKLYANKGIRITANPLEFPRALRSVNIQFQSFDPSIITLLVGEGATFDGEKYSSAPFTVELDETKLVYADQAHYNRIIQDKYANVFQFKQIEIDDDRQRLAQSFLDRIGLGQIYDEVTWREIGEYTLATYEQHYEGVTLIESAASLWIYNGEIVGFVAENQVNISDTVGAKYDIISVDRALYSLLPKMDQREEIEAIEIVYKLNDDNLLVTAFPYYRIVLSSGMEYHIRAVANQ
jgi:hypothetical protein